MNEKNYVSIFIEVDANWARLPEVDNYAQQRGITRGEAVVELANEGLSHQPRSYV